MKNGNDTTVKSSLKTQEADHIMNWHLHDGIWKKGAKTSVQVNRYARAIFDLLVSDPYQRRPLAEILTTASGRKYPVVWIGGIRVAKKDNRYTVYRTGGEQLYPDLHTVFLLKSIYDGLRWCKIDDNPFLDFDPNKY